MIVVSSKRRTALALKIHKKKLFYKSFKNCNKNYNLPQYDIEISISKYK